MRQDIEPHLRGQAEERTHNVWMASTDYQINFNKDLSSFIAYMAFQNTSRDHYTGVFPDDSSQVGIHLSNPPYGLSDVSTSNDFRDSIFRFTLMVLRRLQQELFSLLGHRYYL